MLTAVLKINYVIYYGTLSFAATPDAARITIQCNTVPYKTIYSKKVKGSPYSITERRVTGLIPVLGSQPASDVSNKPGGRLPLLSARPAVTSATLKRAAANFAAW